MAKKKKLAEVGEEKRQEERNRQFVNSFRGGYILGQALHIAIPILEAMEYPENSNIEDMKYLRDNLFPLYSEVHRAVEENPYIDEPSHEPPTPTVDEDEEVPF